MANRSGHRQEEPECFGSSGPGTPQEPRPRAGGPGGVRSTHPSLRRSDTRGRADPVRLGTLQAVLIGLGGLLLGGLLAAGLLALYLYLTGSLL